MRLNMVAFAAFLTLTCTTALAQGQRFIVKGNRLLHNSLITKKGGGEKDIVDRGANELALYLMESYSLCLNDRTWFIPV